MNEYFRPLTQKERDAPFKLTPERVAEFEECCEGSLSRRDGLLELVERMLKDCEDPEVVNELSECQDLVSMEKARFTRLSRRAWVCPPT